MMTIVRNKCREGILFLLMMLAGTVSQAQYYGERVLPKGFETTDFFFTPSNVIPYGLGQFAGTTPGVLRDPLLDLVLNPAYLRLDSTRSDLMIYTDFRAARAIKDQPDFIYPWYRVADMRASLWVPYPTVYLENRRELEPVFSGALIGRPLGELAPGLLVGLTYQLVMQDEKYYSVPQDIYRSVVGADYAETKKVFVDHFNRRGEDYAHFSSDESGPEYGFLRYCGNQLMEILPEKDRVWVVEQVVSIEAPEAVKTLRTAFDNLFATAAPVQPAGQP